jgi:catechol 2,3-dioxygenase-like lactoylglutathione lyase family enzyme
MATPAVEQLDINAGGAARESRLFETIDHVQLPVPSTRLAVDWYTRILGFEATDAFDEDMAVVRLASGPTLFLWRTRDETPANFTKDGEIMPSFGIGCNSIVRLQVILEARHARIISLEIDPEGRSFLKFLDPFGNMIVAHQKQAV